MTSNKGKSLVLLSPLVLTLLGLGAAQASDAVSTTATQSNSPPTLSTQISASEVLSRSRDKLETLNPYGVFQQEDGLAVQCGNYSVDHSGNTHCLHYDSQSGPVPNGVGKAETSKFFV